MTETRFTAYTTAYSWFDNTPPGSPDISHPVIHSVAGGNGTWADPITIAVGHSITGGKDVLDYPAGTKFYIPTFRRYFIVEDTCGDGPKPQNGPCHKNTDEPGYPQIDLWIDGRRGTKAATDKCMDKITGLHLVIKNPASNYKISIGSLFTTACTVLYGDTVVKA